MKVTFTSKSKIDKEFFPRPAGAVLPEWLVKMSSYGGFHDDPEGFKSVTHSGEPNATIKKCVPVADAISAGYIIVTTNDIWVEKAKGEPDQQFKGRGVMSVSFHDFGQAKHHPAGNNGVNFPKLNNPWMIKTPKGYSVLFTAPMHNPNGFFKVFPGIVDTDGYKAAVNFPFAMDDSEFSGLIPAGTPIVQVIPFKRDIWQMEIGGDKEIKEADEVNTRHFSRIFNAYKTLWWNRKEFK